MPGRHASCLPLLLALWLLGTYARADGLYLQGGDQSLREDLQLLIDERVIHLPSMTWPLSRAAVAHALDGADEPDFEFAELRLAWDRVQARVRESENLRLAVTTVVGRPGLNRDFQTPGREEGTLTVAAATRSDSLGLNASLSAVSSASDAQTLRADGSELTFRFRDWLVGINALDRWWGPGEGGSLVLSNNARPMNALMLQRAEARASESQSLRWLGPWHLTVLAGVVDEQPDFSHPLMLGGRFEAVPRPWLDLAVERLADISGVDMRAVSPWRALPAFAYAQLAVADDSQSSPSRFMTLVGVGYWRGLTSGTRWSAKVEYADTRCAWGADAGSLIGRTDCGYDGQLHAGQSRRYLDRTIGYWIDSGAHLLSASLDFTRQAGDVWSVKALSGWLRSEAQRSSSNDAFGTRPAGYQAVEFGWKGAIATRDAHLQIGLQRLAPTSGPSRLGLYGFVGWVRNL